MRRGEPIRFQPENGAAPTRLPPFFMRGANSGKRPEMDMFRLPLAGGG